jgi:hypothetical protein
MKTETETELPAASVASPSTPDTGHTPLAVTGRDTLGRVAGRVRPQRYIGFTGSGTVGRLQPPGKAVARRGSPDPAASGPVPESHRRLRKATEGHGRLPKACFQAGPELNQNSFFPKRTHLLAAEDQHRYIAGLDRRRFVFMTLKSFRWRFHVRQRQYLPERLMDQFMLGTRAKLPTADSIANLAP